MQPGTRNAAPGTSLNPSRFERLPKAELHRHLEGAIRLDSAFEIARSRGIEVPGGAVADFRKAIEMRGVPPGFPAFLEKFKVLHPCWADEAAARRFAREAFEDAAADSIRYLELRYGPAHIARRTGAGIAEVARWMAEEAAAAQRRHGMRVVLIATLLRDFGPKANAEIAAEIPQGAVAALDLAGDEIHFPPEPFAELFAEGRRRGFAATVHAGEAGPPEGIAAAVLKLGASRIGHGIAAARDPNVAALLRERGTVLEICPTSNVQTGAVKDLASHPLPALLRAGLRATINSDDPTICVQRLSEELADAERLLGLRARDLWRMQENALRAAFLPEEEKEALRSAFEREWKPLLDLEG